MERRSSTPPGGLSQPPPPQSDRRFFVEPEGALIDGAPLELGDEAAKHARVCRLAVGDVVELFDGSGHVAAAEITGLWSRQMRVEVRGPAQRAPRGPQLSLVLCMPRAGKLDDIVRMTTEVGVAAIHLALSDFAVGTSARADNKLQRLERVAREALRQCEGAYVPELHAPANLKEILGRLPPTAQRAMLAARGCEPLALSPGDAPAWLVVGPEGGLSPREESLLAAAGFAPASLGPSVLRVETAAVVGCAMALAQLRGRGASLSG